MSIKAIQDDIERSKIIKMDSMKRLLENEDFRLVFMDGYLRESLIELMYREGVKESNINIMNARKIFSDFMYGVIEEGNFAASKKEK